MEIIGHQKIIQFLQKSIANNKLSHAYLFYGPQHIGKTAVVEYFVARLLCSRKKSCGRCLNCRQFFKKVHPDVDWVTEPLIGIDSVRQIIGSLGFKPLFAPYRIAIIEQADNLTIPAANAFLKLLEEAPSKVIIILIAKNFYRLPVTLRSRCQILRFCLPPKSETIDFLAREFALNRDESARIIDLALSRPGVAIDFAKNPAALVEHKRTMAKFMALLSAKNFEQRIKLADTLQDLDFGDLTKLMILVRDLILISLNCQTGISFLKKDSKELDDKKLKELSEIYTRSKSVHLCYQILKIQFWLYSYNVNKRLAVENLLIQLNN